MNISKQDKLKAINLFLNGNYKENDLSDEMVDLLYEKEVIKKLDKVGISINIGPKMNTITEKIETEKLKEEIKNQKKNERLQSKPELITFNNDINKSTPQYKAFLAFLNEILISLNKDPIDDIFKFRNIKKDDLLSKTSKNILDKQINNLIKVFSKDELEYQNRNRRAMYIINVIKNICNIIGCDLEYKRKDTHLDGKKIYTAYYSIC